MTDLLNIAKECGAKFFMVNYPNEYVQIRDDQLHATVEKVCGPLDDALKAAPIVSMFDNAEEFIAEYEKWRDAVKIPASINYGRLIGKYTK